MKVTMEDPSSRSIRLVTEMMVLVGEGMGRCVCRQDEIDCCEGFVCFECMCVCVAPTFSACCTVRVPDNIPDASLARAFIVVN